MSYEEFDDSIVEEFIAESKEHLASIEDDFLALEKNHEDRQLLDKVFRAIHSIKGSAGFLNFTKINDLSHIMETLLTMMREGVIRPETRFVDALLAGVDLLSQLLDDVKNSNNADIAAIHSRISGLIAAARAGAAAPAPVPATVPVEKPGPEAAGETAEPTIETTEAAGGQSLPGPEEVSLIQLTPIQPAPPTTGASQPAEPVAETAREPKAGEAEAEAPKAKPPAAPASAPAGGGKPTKGGTIRISVDIADTLMMLASELVLVRNQQLLNVDKTQSTARNIVQRLDVVTSELQETIMRTRLQPLDNVFGKFPRVVRELAKKLGKEIEIVITGKDEELDKTLLESLADPLTHLIRNSCDHGIESPAERVKAGKPACGTIYLSAYHEGGQVNIDIIDDGQGMDPARLKKAALDKGLKTKAELAQMSDKECISLIMLPGFSTAGKVSDVSGRGVGMDVVRANLEKLGGVVDIESVPGKGSTVHLRLPLTLAIIPCLIVMVGEYRYAIPQVNLEEAVCLYDDEILTRLEYTDDQEIFRLRGRLLPMIRLSEVLAKPLPFAPAQRSRLVEKYRLQQNEMREKYQAGEARGGRALNFVVLKSGANRFGLIVDKIMGTEEIVVKPMHSALKALRCYAGATVLGDGQVALILDIEGTAGHAGILLGRRLGEHLDKADTSATHEKQTVILFANGPREQFALALPLIKRIERISASAIETVGGKDFVTIEGMSTLVLRLDQHLKVSPCLMQEEMFLLLPKHIKRPFGILISSLKDIVEAPMELNIESYTEPGLMGTQIVKGQMTLFIDLYRLIEKAMPEWFPEGHTGQRKNGAANRLLLVEDSPFFQQLLKGYLKEEGYQVAVADNGRKALGLMDGSDFDMIVSDLEMPEMNGWDFIKNVREKARQHTIPALALTSVESSQGRSRAMELGFNRYEIKIDRVRLMKTITELLQKR